MGADGHIQIYDRTKVEEKFTPQVFSEFFEEFKSGKFYRQHLNGKEYLTRYWGDNYNCDDTYDVVEDTYSRTSDSFNENSWGFNKWEAGYFMGLTKEKRQLYHEIIEYMENECLLTTWEVWT